MKEIEAYRLLDLDSGALRAVSPDVPDLDIAAAPEIVQILFLGRQKRLEPLVHEAIQSPTSAITQFLSRGCMGRVINHVFGELNWATGPSFDRERNLAKVLSVRGLVGVCALGFQCVVNRACQAQAALFRRMTTTQSDGHWRNRRGDGASDRRRPSSAAGLPCWSMDWVHSQPSRKR